MGRWTYTGPDPAERRRLVLEILRENGGMMKSREIAEKLGISQCLLCGRQKQATLTELQRDGLVQRIGCGRGAKWMAYTWEDEKL